MEEEPQGAISGGTEEQWTVSELLSEFDRSNSLKTCMSILAKALHFYDLGR